MRKVEKNTKKLIANKHFHQKKLADGLLNFEVHETTCSFILRHENLFLSGDSYGKRLFDKIYQKNNKITSVLEIGAGLGYLAKKFIKRHKEICDSKLSYTIFDLSPELIENQKKNIKASKVSWIEGDALEISKKIKDKSFDVVIANEMLADLPVEVLEKKGLPESTKLNSSQIKTITSFQKNFEGNIFIPVGLLKMVSELKKFCHPDSKIILSEYFTRHGGGNIVPLHQHDECRLNLNLTAELIRNEGFDVEVISMIDYLEMNLNVQPLSKELTKFFSDNLAIFKSRTSPFAKKELIGMNLSKTAFCRAEWLSVFSNYYFLILSPKVTPAHMGAAQTLKIYKNECVSVVSNKKESFLVLTHPAKALPLSKDEKRIWVSIKSGTSIKKIKNLDLTTWFFLKKLEVNGYLSFK
ncbi:MAG: class I SAM-dependent methyltransferase [Bdellovibrionales bacterium]|nr:class I SAM-dependent methyltransferase [Bdellovibrionales bacterium]